MKESGIRPATPGDNEALLELERACPQGSRLIMHSERKDYLYRGRLFGNDHITVAVDHGRIFGVLAATLKRVMLDGKAVTAAYFYDLRIHPDYRRSVPGRNMLRAWLETEKWAEESGAEIMYGTVKGDNELMLALQQKKRAYRFAGEMLIVSRPVFRKKAVDCLPELVDLDSHGDTLAAEVFSEYGSRNLYPADLTHAYLTSQMRQTGLFSCYRVRKGDSWASVGLYRISRQIWMRVIKLPWYYRAARVVSGMLKTFLPVPVIPPAGGEVRYYHVFNHLAEGPDGMMLWRKLLAFINNLAFEEEATLITGCFDPADRFCLPFKRGAVNTIAYKIGYKPLRGNQEYSFFPFAPDARDMD